MRKRKPNIAQSLFKNSKSAFFSTIEIHNKPNFEYRYEICTLLLINARELIIKGYIYKNYNKECKIFNRDWTTIDFIKCLNFMKDKLWKDFLITKTSIEKIYDFRNKIAHCYFEPMDWILFILFQPNIKFYTDFVIKYIDTNFFTEKDNQFLILPVWIKHILSPVDILTNYSTSKKSSKIVQDFIKWIIQSSSDLLKEWIEYSILADYKIYFHNEKSSKNAEILVKFQSDWNPFHIHNKIENIKITTDINAKKVILSPDEILKTHPLSPHEMRNKMRDIYSNYPDWKWEYNKLIIELKKNSNLCIPYLSNPWSKKPQYKYYYSNDVYRDFFDNYYSRK